MLWTPIPGSLLLQLHQSIKTQDRYGNGQTNLGHKHKAPDHNHEATQPMVNLPHTSYSYIRGVNVFVAKVKDCWCLAIWQVSEHGVHLRSPIRVNGMKEKVDRCT